MGCSAAGGRNDVNLRRISNSGSVCSHSCKDRGCVSAQRRLLAGQNQKGRRGPTSVSASVCFYDDNHKCSCALMLDTQPLCKERTLNVSLSTESLLSVADLFCPLLGVHRLDRPHAALAGQGGGGCHPAHSGGHCRPLPAGHRLPIHDK